MKSNSLDIHPSGAFVSPERSCLASVNKSCCPPVEQGWVRKKIQPVSSQLANNQITVIFSGVLQKSLGRKAPGWEGG